MGTSMINNNIDNGGVKGVKYPWHHWCIVLFPLRIFVFWRDDNDMIELPPICYFLFNFITPLGVICKIQFFRNIWLSMDFLVICLDTFEHLFQRNYLLRVFFFWFDFKLVFFSLVWFWFFWLMMNVVADHRSPENTIGSDTMKKFIVWNSVWV